MPSNLAQYITDTGVGFAGVGYKIPFPRGDYFPDTSRGLLAKECKLLVVFVFVFAFITFNVTCLVSEMS